MPLLLRHVIVVSMSVPAVKERVLKRSCMLESSGELLKVLTPRFCPVSDQNLWGRPRPQLACLLSSPGDLGLL